jgi:hypothetical protein
MLCTSRASICTTRSPALSREPTDTGIWMTVPEALDFTSTRLTGSIVPEASIVSETS